MTGGLVSSKGLLSPLAVLAFSVLLGVVSIRRLENLLLLVRCEFGVLTTYFCGVQHQRVCVVRVSYVGVLNVLGNGSEVEV